MSAREFRDRLRRRARKAGVDLSADLADALERYYALLAKWNAKINLTSFRLDAGGQDEAVDRLLIEPLVAARHVPPNAHDGHRHRLRRRLAGDSARAGGAAATAPDGRVEDAEGGVPARGASANSDSGCAEVETSRFEELLARPELHEGLDLLTIRAVRIEPRTLFSLQAFLRPGGQLFLFRGPGGTDVADAAGSPSPGLRPTRSSSRSGHGSSSSRKSRL